jgi:hypothetical protein
VVVGAPGARHADSWLTAELAERVRKLAASYEAPDFSDAPGPDAALFLCAVDHSSGYGEPHVVDGEELDGSALLWALGCAAERSDPGLLSAASLADVDAGRVEEMFRTGGETASGAGERARLWRDLAAGLSERYEGSAATLLEAAGSRLGGARGLIARLAEFEAYADPLAKKSFLFAKIAARRGWLEVADPGSWEVCADNVLMRIALRSGLVAPGPLDEVRSRTRESGLLGSAGGKEVREPRRREGVVWY